MVSLKFEYKENGIILRVVHVDEVSSVLRFYQKNHNTFDCYETDKPDNFYEKEFQRSMLQAENDLFLKGMHARYFLFDGQYPDTIIGTVSFFNIRRGDFNHCSIGYKIDEEYRNLGYGTKMLNLAVKIATSDFQIHRIEAMIMPDNTPSIRLAAKCGFTFEGLASEFVKMRGKWVDHERWVLIA